MIYLVEASSEGSNSTWAIAGAQGGISIVPVVAINMVNNYVRASIDPFSGSTLMVNGDVLVRASAIRTTQTGADAEAGGEGVAVGAAVALGLIDMLEEAILDRNIGSSDSRADSVSVIAIGVNSNEVTAYAGKNGGKEDSGQDDGEDAGKGSITDLFDRATSVIKSIRGSQNLPEKETTSTAKDQKAETPEGTLNFAAALALAVVDSSTISAVGRALPVIIYTGDISIITRTNKDVIANANASATKAEGESTKVGIGAAAAIINVTTRNNALLGNGSKVYATGDVYIKSIMEEVEETTTTNAEHNYGVAAQSGAGGSVLSLAGAVAISIIDSDFLVSVDGTLEAEGKIDMEADAAQYVQTIATALPVKTIAGKDAKKRNKKNNTEPSGEHNGGVGIGASFALANINTSVSVKTAHGAVLKSGRELKTRSTFTNRVTTVAESGEDVIDDDEDDEDKLDEDYSELNSKYNRTALDAAVAISTINITVEAVIGAPQSPDVPNILVGKDLILEAVLNSIIKTTSKSIVEATNAAAGATLSLNIIEGLVIADMAGYAQVSEKAVVTAKAYTVDESDAYATAKGVQLKRHERKLGIPSDDILDGNTGDDNDKFPASQKVLNNEDIGKYTETVNVDQNNGNTSKGSKISVAAAVAVNVVEHNVIAAISGKIANATSLEVEANNENNFMAYATGAGVNNGNAISVAVAVAVNNSKTHAILGSAENIKGDISIESNTLHNLSQGYENKISAQAIAGSKAGKDGKFGAAGAVAVLVSNAETKAYILDHVSVKTDKSISIKAKEKSKLAIRAWGATLITNTSDVKDQMGDSSGTTAGIGAAFAILHANNQIIAYIGDGSSIIAGSIDIASIKERVEYTGGDLPWDDLKDVLPSVDELKDAFSPESDDSSTSISVDAKAIEKIVNGLNGMDLALTAAEYMNLVASNNYYVEAAGGSISSVSSDTKFSGAGSFAIMYFRNKIDAYIGDGVTVTILPGTSKENSIEIIAKSDINAKGIGGSIATGGDTSAGLTAVVIYNEDEISAYIGKDASISGFEKGIDIEAESLQDYVIIAVGAAAADKNGIAGIVNGILSNNSVKAYIDSSNGVNKISGSGNLTITAVNDTEILGILGGITYGKSAGIGISCLFLTLSNSTEAYIGNGVWLGIGPGTITIKASATESIIMVSANGAFSQGSSISVGPVFKLINSSVKAYIGSQAQISAGEINITADSKTDILSIAGSVSASFGKLGVGAVADTNIYEKTVYAYIGDGARINCVGDINIHANSVEKIGSYVVGISISTSASVNGSAAVNVIGNDIQAYLGNNVEINKDTIRAGNISITANQKVDMLTIVGGISGSTGSTAVGVSSGTIVFDGRTISYIGNNAKVNASAITVTSNSRQNILVVIASGGVSSNVAVNGAVNVLVFEQETSAYIGENAFITSNGGITIKAKDDTSLLLISGNIGISGSVAVGASNITVTFDKDLSAYIDINSVISNNSNHSIRIEATNTLDMLLVAAGLGGSGNAAVQGSIIVLVIKDNVSSHIAGNTNTQSLIKTDGSIVILAESKHNLLNVAGNAAGSGTTAIGIASVVSTFEGLTQAYIGKNANISALGKGNKEQFYDGSTNGAKGNYSGILIGSYSTQDIQNWVISGAASGTVTVTGSVNVVVMDQTTDSYILEDCRIQGRYSNRVCQENHHYCCLSSGNRC